MAAAGLNPAAAAAGKAPVLIKEFGSPKAGNVSAAVTPAALKVPVAAASPRTVDSGNVSPVPPPISANAGVAPVKLSIVSCEPDGKFGSIPGPEGVCPDKLYCSLPGAGVSTGGVSTGGVSTGGVSTGGTDGSIVGSGGG